MKVITQRPKVIAVDLIDTLIERGKDAFSNRVAHALSGHGVDRNPIECYEWFRKRYLEYSMGNYADDSEFCMFLAAEIPAISEKDVQTEILEIMYDCNRPFDESTAFLERAAGLAKVILCSNHVSTWVDRIIAHNHWEQYFDALVVSSQVGYRKPARGFFQQVLRVANVSPDTITLVGDSYVNDVIGASCVGIKPVLLCRSSKSAPGDDLDAVSSLTEFIELIESAIAGPL